MGEENKGCLLFFLDIFKQKKTKEEIFPYSRKDFILSKAEYSFYKVLVGALDNESTVLVKLRLSDLFYVKKVEKKMAYQNKINSKHIDFLLCEKESLKPVIAIELDDSSHNRQKRQDRDSFVDKLFETAKLPLLRIPCKRSYNPKEIIELIQNKINETYNESFQRTSHCSAAEF